MTSLVSTLRLAWRRLARSPGFTAVAVLTLAVGIGANTVVFTWVQSTLLNSIPKAEHASRLVVLAPQHRATGLGETMSIPDLESLAAERTVFTGVTGSQMGTVPVRLSDSTEWLWGQTTMANFFDVLGVRLGLGRGFLPGEDRPGAAEHVAVISHELWERRFNSSPEVIGRIIQLHGRPATIVGVAPAGFRGTVGGLQFDLWVPLATESDSDLQTRHGARDRRWLQAIARLAPACTLAQARSASATVGQRLASEFPASNRDLSFSVMPLWEAPWGGQALFLPLLRVLALVGAVVVVLVTANLGHLLLARTMDRERELAVRLALGSSAASLLRHALTESLLLAALGGTGGLAFALWGRHLLLALMPPTYLPVGYDLGMGIGVFAATAAITVVVGLLLGILPAWRALHTDLNRTLRSSGLAGAASRHHVWVRQALAAGQIALALVLLIGASLCVRSFVKARRVELGFEPRGVWLAGFRLNPHKGDDAAVQRFYERLRTGCAQLPGVTSAALSSYLPLGLEGVDQTDVTVPGYVPQPGEDLRAGVELVSPGYFQTMGMRLPAGREFTETDDSRAPLVAVVNEAFAQRFFPGRDPVGLTFKQPRGEVRVIGVSATGKYRSLAESPFPYFYLCASQYAERNMTLALRTAGEPAVVAPSIVRLALALDPETPPHAAQSCGEYVAAALTIPRVAMTLLSALGFLAVALAVMGCYAVMAQGARERTRELGVRAALGASPFRNLRLMLRRGLVVTGIGVGLGIVLGAGLAQALASLLVGVSAADPATWLLAPLVLVITILTACWVPSHRAAHADPMVALRCD